MPFKKRILRRTKRYTRKVYKRGRLFVGKHHRAIRNIAINAAVAAVAPYALGAAEAYGVRGAARLASFVRGQKGAYKRSAQVIKRWRGDPTRILGSTLPKSVVGQRRYASVAITKALGKSVKLTNKPFHYKFRV